MLNIFALLVLSVKYSTPKILNKAEASGKRAKFRVELGAYDITYEPRSAIKGQVLVDFQLDTPIRESTEFFFRTSYVISEKDDMEAWTLFIDGTSSTKGSRAGLVLIALSGVEYTYTPRLSFDNTNNEAKYEALLAGLRIARKIRVHSLEVKITVLKTNTPYPSRKIRRIRACTHQRPQKIKDQYAVSRGLNTPYSRYGINIIFWKISNVVPTLRNPQYASLAGLKNVLFQLDIRFKMTIDEYGVSTSTRYDVSSSLSNTAYSIQQINTAYLLPLNTTMTKVIKGEFKKIKDIKVENDSLTCDSPLEVFNCEVSRLSKMDDDLFTYEVEIANIPCDLRVDDDSEHEADDMGFDPSDIAFTEWLGLKFFNYKIMDHYTMKASWIYWIRGDDEVELTDEEFSDNEDEITEVFRIDTNIFDYETPICSAFNEFNYLLKVDPNLLTKDIMGFKTYDDY
ncbi:VIER F-box protein 2 [Tanacetum coccineum]